MQSSAARLAAERNSRVSRVEAEEAARQAEEDKLRSARGELGASYLAQQQKAVFTGQMDLGERMRRAGRVGMVGDGE